MSDKIIWDAFSQNRRDLGEPPMPPSIDERVAKLETGVALINQKLDTFGEHYATKEGLKDLELNISRWFMATTLVLVGVILGAAAFF